MDAGLGPKPLEYEVAEIAIVRDFHDFCTYLFYFLKPTQIQIQQGLLLMCKIVGTNMDLRLYYQTEFQPDGRPEIIERGDAFLFQPPADATNFQPRELKFTPELQHGENAWVMKGFGEVHGSASFKPPKLQYHHVGQVFATVAEYDLTQGETPDTEVIILEFGTEEGSLVTLYAGCAVNLSEIDVYPVKEE